MFKIDNDETIDFQCRHIFTDGRRCASPTLRSPGGHEPFCFYHHNTRGAVSMTSPTTSRVPHPRGASSRVGGGQNPAFDLPLPEDRSSIQHAIGEVLRRIASGEIDSRRAGLLLYGLQIASLNLKRDHRNTEDPSTDFVTEITHDPDLGLLAPPAELHANEPIGSAQRLLEDLLGDDDEPSPIRAPRPSPAHQSTAPSRPSMDGTSSVVDAANSTAPGNLTIDLQACAVSERETIFRMSNFIPKPATPKLSGLGPKAQRLAALREKAAAQADGASAHATDTTAAAAKPKNNVAKKTAFQRKAT